MSGHTVLLVGMGYMYGFWSCGALFKAVNRPPCCERTHKWGPIWPFTMVGTIWLAFLLSCVP